MEIYNKSILEVILKNKLTFYDQWFARYVFWPILGHLGPISAQKMGFAPPSSLITKSILKIYSLRITKQLFSGSLQ